MSDRVIRITSQQGFSDSWENTEKPTGLNLLDFTIPRGMNINMEKSYIAINAQIDSNSAYPVNSSLYLGVQNDVKVNVPTTALIRNASLNNDRGNVENIRRVDTLSCALFGLMDEAEERKSNMNTFSQFEGGRGLNNETSFNLDAVTNNTTPDGTIIDTTNNSRNISRDIKIPLKELFGVCNSEAYSTDIWGETRIHCETNMVINNIAGLKNRHLGGAESTSLMFDKTLFYGDMVDQTAVAGGSSTTALETKGTYDDFQNVMPFFVGQEVTVTGSVSGTATTQISQITGIRYGTDNTATPPTNTGSCFLTLDPPFYANPAGQAAKDITAMKMDAVTTATLKTVVNRAELVLTLTDEEPNEEIVFNTITTEQDNGNQQNSFTRTYLAEPEANAIMIACCGNGNILPDAELKSYRYAVDNEEMTGNRDIVIGSPIQFDRLQRCLDRQIGLGIKNFQQKFYVNDQQQPTAYLLPVSLVCETLHQTEGNKNVNIQIQMLDAGTLEQIILYKNMEKTLK